MSVLKSAAQGLLSLSRRSSFGSLPDEGSPSSPPYDAGGSQRSSKGSPGGGEGKSYPTTASAYVLLEECGRGTTSTVFKAACIPLGNEVVAIKRCNLDCPLNDLVTEVQLMCRYRHRNLLPLLCSFVDGEFLYLVMPYMAGGSVALILRRGFPEGLEETEIATIMRDVLRALEYVHCQGAIHRDVKGGNILMDGDGTVRLGDMGVSATMERASSWGNALAGRNTIVGSPAWMAPEVVEQEAGGYNTSADIWSFGITLLELAHGQAPYASYPPLKVLMMTVRNPPTADMLDNPELAASKVLNPLNMQPRSKPGAPSSPGSPSPTARKPKVFSSLMHDVLAQCLQRDPALRPTASALLNHRFFKQARDQVYLQKRLLAPPGRSVASPSTRASHPPSIVVEPLSSPSPSPGVDSSKSHQEASQDGWNWPPGAILPGATQKAGELGAARLGAGSSSLESTPPRPRTNTRPLLEQQQQQHLVAPTRLQKQASCPIVAAHDVSSLNPSASIGGGQPSAASRMLDAAVDAFVGAASAARARMRSSPGRGGGQQLITPVPPSSGQVPPPSPSQAFRQGRFRVSEVGTRPTGGGTPPASPPPTAAGFHLHSPPLPSSPNMVNTFVATPPSSPALTAMPTILSGANSMLTALQLDPVPSTAAATTAANALNWGGLTSVDVVAAGPWAAARAAQGITAPTDLILQMASVDAAAAGPWAAAHRIATPADLMQQLLACDAEGAVIAVRGATAPRAIKPDSGAD